MSRRKKMYKELFELTMKIHNLEVLLNMDRKNIPLSAREAHLLKRQIMYMQQYRSILRTRLGDMT